MKKHTLVLTLVIALSFVLGACSSNKEAPDEPSLSAKEMVDQMMAEVEQPELMELEEDMVEQLYHLDPALLEEYNIRTPFMNVSTTEISVLKVKDAKDIPTVESAIKERATDVQKSFESYLPDQYENAKNYKLVTKGNYLLFVISDKADELVATFETFFIQK